MMNRAYALLVVHMQKFSRHSSYSFRSIRLVSLPELSSVFCFDGTAHSLLSQFFRNVVVFSRLFYDSISRQTVLLDRKSTRLNSSHVSISYAVFCSKKKRTQSAQSDSLHCAAPLV